MTSLHVKRDFLQELKAIFNKIETPKPFVREPEKLFNIHKRSLPVGIDKVIVIGVNRKDGQRMLENSLKARIYFDEVKESKTIIYFDLVPQGATPKERNLFYNPVELLIDQST